ncbi:hypothetical protein EC957_001098, partial [Mortierella hygrophila]
MTERPPRVFITGANLGGHFLGILIEKAWIPFEIFERSAEIKPLDKLDLIGKNEGTSAEFVGCDRLLCTRPELYDILLKRILSCKIHMSKRVLYFGQNHEGVTVQFSGNTSMHSDILVGADGAHSAVRQHLDSLPKTDTGNEQKNISLLGTTEPLDPAKFPEVLNSKDYFVVGDKDTPYTLGITEIAHEQLSYSDWIPQLNQEMMDPIRHFVTPYRALGDLFDATDIEKVSKVYFEDKLFETWTHGRTVLIGDAAHM